MVELEGRLNVFLGEGRIAHFEMDECSVVEGHRTTWFNGDVLVDGSECIMVFGLIVENSGKLILVVGAFHVIKLKKKCNLLNSK